MSAGAAVAMNPFAFWSGMLEAWQMNTATSARLYRTTVAAETVVAARTEIMRAAIAMPASTDFGELTRMAPEKAMAFAQSLAVVTRACLAMQSLWWKQAEVASAMMTAGRMPTAAELTDLWSGAVQTTLSTTQTNARAGRDALAPVARAVAGNARRLARRPA